MSCYWARVCVCSWDWVFRRTPLPYFYSKSQTRHQVLGTVFGQTSDALCFLYYTVPDRRSGTSLYLRASRRTVVRINNIKHHLFSLHSNHAHVLRSWYRMVRSPFLPKGATWVSLFSCLAFGLVFIGFLYCFSSRSLFFVFFIGSAMLRSEGYAPHSYSRSCYFESGEFVVEHKSFAVMFLRSHKWTCAFSVLLTCGFSEHGSLAVT